MSTISKANCPKFDDELCQGDIYQDVQYNYIFDEKNDYVEIVEMVFPYAIIVSQACDVISMSKMVSNKKGNATKFMPSILMCPIYNAELVKNGEHLKDVTNEYDLSVDDYKIFSSKDKDVYQKDWHYRFHDLTLLVDGKECLGKSIIDYKHYFTVPVHYLLNNKEKRKYHLDDIYAEQITLKFATYLSRVAIPDD